MSLVFLDTVGLLALWNRNDPWRAEAKTAFDGIIAEGRKCTTTSFVLLECGNAAARQPFRRDVVELRESLEAKQLLIHPTEHDWKQAWPAYQRGEAGAAGIVDHVSFVIMRRLGISDAFTNDRHFTAAGFHTLF